MYNDQLMDSVNVNQKKVVGQNNRIVYGLHSMDLYKFSFVHGWMSLLRKKKERRKSDDVNAS